MAAQSCCNKELDEPRFTAPRQAVLDIVKHAAAPLGAYDILRAMTAGTKPPTVYRALEFLEREGLIHKIATLNRYIACHAGHRHEGAQFLICDGCGGVEEAHICHMPNNLDQTARARGFRARGWFFEMRGLCRDCA